MAEYMEKSEQQKSRAYSPAVITQGGRTVWLAGQTATRTSRATTFPEISRRRSAPSSACSTRR